MFQGCVDVLWSLKEGDFGPCEEEIEKYVAACTARFPYAIAFKPPAPPKEFEESETNEDTQIKEVVNNWVKESVLLGDRNYFSWHLGGKPILYT